MCGLTWSRYCASITTYLSFLAIDWLDLAVLKPRIYYFGMVGSYLFFILILGIEKYHVLEVIVLSFW